MKHLRHLKRVIDAIQRESIFCNEGIPTIEEALLEEFNVRINRKGITLHVDLAPKSGKGHDYMFSVNILTGKIDKNSITIGELISEPEEEL